MTIDFNKNTDDILNDFNQKVIEDEKCKTVDFNINNTIHVNGINPNPNTETYSDVLKNIINNFNNQNKN